MNVKCICELCNCRLRHKCPFRHIAAGSFSNLTEYAKNYHAHPFHRRKSFKPEVAALQSDVPISDKTTNRQDYVRYPLERPYIRAPERYKKPPGEIDLLTCYTKEYTNKPLDPAKAIRHEEKRTEPSKFDAVPTYTSDYRKWRMEKVKSFKPEEVWVPPTVKIDGKSVTAKDYRQYNERPRESCKPADGTVHSDVPFTSTTVYRDQYVRYPILAKPIKEHEVYKPPGVPMDGITIFRKDYQGRPGEKRKSCKPENACIKSDVPIENMTTFRYDYQRWPVKQPNLHNPDPYKKPDGEIDLNTTHKLTYRPQPLEPALSYKPAEVAHVPGTFQNATCYRTDFKKWNVKPSQPMLQPEYKPNTAPFDGISTVMAHYGPKPFIPTASCRPKLSQISSAPFDGNTMYRTEYIPKQGEPCPAAIVDTQRAKHVFVNVDPLGHRFYRPAHSLASPLAVA